MIFKLRLIFIVGSYDFFSYVLFKIDLLSSLNVKLYYRNWARFLLINECVKDNIFDYNDWLLLNWLNGRL